MISALNENFKLQNTLCILPVKILIRLEIKLKCLFSIETIYSSDLSGEIN